MKLLARMKPTITSGLRLTILLIMLCVPVITYWGCGSSGSSPGEPQVLARVEVPGYLEDLSLPVYADLEDAEGDYYALVIATKTELDKAGATYRVIDQYLPGTFYLMAVLFVEGV